METIAQMKRPSKVEMRVAAQSYNTLAEVIEQITKEQTEIEIEETKEKIIIPSRALKLLGEILKAMAQGNPISIVPIAAEVTTQQAAEMIGCSRPFLVKLLEEGKIEFTKVGRHRRIMFDDIIKYKKIMKEEQKKHIIDIMNFDEEIGMYDS
jgi:excisionase family DNA binding protein